MVKLHLVHASNAKFVQNHPLVAVCVAGTGGIGEYIVRALASTYVKHNPDNNPPQNQNQSRLRIYIVGRNAQAASDLISECEQLYANGEFIFVQADDLTLLRNVDAVCKEIIRLEEEKAAKGLGEARIDLLYMTQGRVMLGPRRGEPYHPVSHFCPCISPFTKIPDLPYLSILRRSCERGQTGRG